MPKDDRMLLLDSTIDYSTILNNEVINKHGQNISKEKENIFNMNIKDIFYEMSNVLNTFSKEFNKALSICSELKLKC